MSAVLAANLPPAARGNVYDKAAALEFFKSAGTPETIAQGAALFVEHQHAARLGVNLDKMYLLVDGAIDSLASRKPIGAVKPGEIFGEMGPLSGAARSATAIARTPCQVIGMDEAQLRRGLQVKPEFVLTLSQLMIARLRETLARLRAANAIAEDASGKQTMLFDGAILGYLRRELERTASMRFQAGQTILREGASGILMYVVLEGGVAVYIQQRRVERIGPGGVLGEIALLDQSPRVASALAETDCTLLGMNRITLLRVLRNKPEFGAALLRGLADRLRFLISRHR
jgi:CRP/FNR family cyclic AMP-dependent transcriptional regulator